MTVIKNPFMWLLLITFCVIHSNADIYLKIAARNLPNLGSYSNANGSVLAQRTDPYANMHVNSRWNLRTQNSETLEKDNHPDWEKVFSVSHGKTIWFWVWDSDEGNKDDSCGNVEIKVEDLHFLEFKECYRYSLQHEADENVGQYLLIQRVDSNGDRPGEINCDGIIHK